MQLFFFAQNQIKTQHSVLQRLRMKTKGKFYATIFVTQIGTSVQTFTKASYHAADRLFCWNVRQEKTSKKAADVKSSCGRSKPFAPIPFATETTEVW